MTSPKGTPKNHFFGKAFHRKDGDTTRSVMSFDKWDAANKRSIKPRFIEYEDGSRYDFFDGPVTFKMMDAPKGNHYANVYQTEWIDPSQGSASDDFDDEDIPF